MFAGKRVRFLQEREGLTLQSGRVLDAKLERSKYLPIEKGTVFAEKLWQLFKSINTGLERPEGYYHEQGGTIMPLTMLGIAHFDRSRASTRLKQRRCFLIA